MTTAPRAPADEGLEAYSPMRLAAARRDGAVRLDWDRDGGGYDLEPISLEEADRGPATGTG